MQRSIPNKTSSPSLIQRLKALLGQTSFVVTLCATLALVLGAISVGAAGYLTGQPKSTPIPVVASADEPKAAPSEDKTLSADQSPAATEPAPIDSTPTIAQPADTYVPAPHKPGLVSLKLNTDSAHVEATIQTPKALGTTPITITLPRDGVPVISGPTKLVPNL